jgi:TonB family protein
MRILPAVLMMTLCLGCAKKTAPVAANAAAPTLPTPAVNHETSITTQTPAQRPIIVSPGVVAGMLAEAKGPIYPPDAKAKKLEGVVTLHAIIGKDGSIADLKIISATDPIFVDAAIAAVGRWKYRPYLLNGVPVEVQTSITVNFKMGK